MSLLSEVSATVLQYQNLSNSVVLSNTAVVPAGITNLTLVGKTTPTSVPGIYPLLDVITGERLDITGLIVNNVLMESGADGPVVVNPPLSVNFDLVAATPDLSSYTGYSGAPTITDEQGVNEKFFVETCDGSCTIEPGYPVPAIRTETSSSGTIVSGSVVVTFNCISF